jgi:nicotinic acid mononucleotide adenylyltransferase
MKEQSDWTPEDLATLESVTQTADGVRLLSKVLRSADRMKAGQFSTYAPQKESAENLTNRDRIAMCERAYAMPRTNPEEARQELNRLARMFEK